MTFLISNGVNTTLLSSSSPLSSLRSRVNPHLNIARLSNSHRWHLSRTNMAVMVVLLPMTCYTQPLDHLHVETGRHGLGRHNKHRRHQTHSHRHRHRYHRHLPLLAAAVRTISPLLLRLLLRPMHIATNAAQPTRPVSAATATTTRRETTSTRIKRRNAIHVQP